MERLFRRLFDFTAVDHTDLLTTHQLTRQWHPEVESDCTSIHRLFLLVTS
jgi:hypothetical protein